jgi:zinc transport system ATP-binding protein
MNNILEVKNLTVEFNGEKILDDLSFSLKERENLIVIGPNGAGKSVLLRALINALPYRGEIIWKKDVKIGYVPQKFLPEKNIPLSIKEFFEFKIQKAADAGDKIKEVLGRVGLTDTAILKNRIGDISFGQLQRVLIAWSLLEKPEVLLFDEPFSGIDIEGEETIYNLLAQIEKELDLTIILVTHDLSVVYKLADSVLCINRKPICYGKPVEVLSRESLEKLYGGGLKFHYPEQHKHGYGHEFI